MILTLVMCVDKTLDWKVAVQAKGLLLFPVVADASGTKLVHGDGISVSNEGPQTLTLTLGVYMLSTDQPLQYQQMDGVRVQLIGGKDPWPTPPPPPPGSDLATTHKELFTKENVKALGPSPEVSEVWVEVKGVARPRSAAASAAPVRTKAS